MAKVIGFDATKMKQFTCYECTAIVQYAPNEAKYIDRTDEGTKIKGLNCPNCGVFHRTNP
jgi:Pyruvate/2-oxoacid:ferredoxin oxidoreductase delta subunit